MVQSALWLATGAMTSRTHLTRRARLVLFRFRQSKTLRLRQHYSGPKTHPKRICIANVHWLGRASLLGLLDRSLRSFHVGSQGSYGYQHFGRRLEMGGLTSLLKTICVRSRELLLTNGLLCLTGNIRGASGLLGDIARLRFFGRQAGDCR
jgi:hypothetical protein